MLPVVGFSRREMQKPNVLLPEPDSPTTASVVPCATANDTPPSATNSSLEPAEFFRWYFFTSFSTLKIGSMFVAKRRLNLHT
jgi:hypothetical protein